MSKINAVRLINLNYNNNAIRISDETFRMNGESTLLSLRNGGGKSVLVQMMMAPFVHKRYRDARERPFESYFTTGKPTFILVEWTLDHGAGYVMTGMMVRRRQEITEDVNDNLEIIQFISEYRTRCEQDIYHLPVVEKQKKEIVLKNFSACRQLFETYKKDRSKTFFCYDMNNSAQSRQYFDKLAEYRIHYKEWETIMKKVNLKESGLSDLFADCKDEKGLVEKWLLDAVESKLNKDKNRMKEFQTIIEKYTGQYKDNRAKIQRRDTIRRFREEADGIFEAAGSYEAAEQEVQTWQDKIGVFFWQLGQAREQAQEACGRIMQKKEAVALAIARLKYQQISKDIHEAARVEKYHRANCEMIQLECEVKEKECAQIGELLNLYECARQQQEINAQRQECLRYEQQLAVLGQKEQFFEEERNNLGYTLKQHYAEEIEKNHAEAARKEASFTETAENIQAEEEKITACQGEVLALGTQIGGIQAQIGEYDAREETFNRRYEPGFVRNLLGMYEPAALEIRRQEYEKELDKLQKENLRARRAIEEENWAQHEGDRNLEELKQKQMQAETDRKEAEALCAQYERQLKERKVILRYFGLDVNEDVLYDKEKILNAAAKKLAEIETGRRRLEKEEDLLQKELCRLTQGKILELPDAFEQLLGELGISYVYGMEWLKKNNCSAEENKKLVDAHPFLPYALIVSARDLTRLSEQKETPYTSFPIPILVREELERPGAPFSGGLLRLSDVNFYVLFNRHLLDEEKLKQMIAEKEQQIQKKQELLQIRVQEYEAYFEKKEQVRAQTVTKELQEKAAHRRASCEEEAKASEEAILKQRGIQEERAQNLKRLHAQVLEMQKDISFQERRLEDLADLEKAYERYTGLVQALEQAREKQERMQEKIRIAEEICGSLREQKRSLENELEHLHQEGAALAGKAVCYDKYEPAQKVQGGIEELENRFQAITSRLSLQQQEIERLLQNAAGKLRKMELELTRRRKKFGLEDGAWKDITYDMREEEHQEQILSEKADQLELKKAEWNRVDKKAALAAQELSQLKKKLFEDCHEKDPLPESEIKPLAFEDEIERRNYAYQELERAQEEEQRHKNWYEENLTALAEYAEFAPQDTQQYEKMLPQDMQAQKPPAELSGEDLRKRKGMLVRDYNHSLEKRRKQKERLTERLNRMVRMEEFADDFYRKPIEAMLTLTDEAGQVIRQLQTTLQSYENLMEKIQVDISVVEEEKQRIVELLEEYAHEVHVNLGRIDQNSTIPVRGRSVKMLKIALPDWEENKNLYRIRITDFMDETTQRGIAILDKNENVQEYFGARVTTRNLYDAVAGVGNVRIRLYKIEEQREYPITWSQVSRNSGGEGFLSAFIILSSLLYYMRRDDSDIFAEHNEGKVLVMDNPFAQTNAAHLLKPLMDMAKKTNTQLICLSGLGGESIYNRFDNIYVLNLIAANLRNGMQYLKADHMRGAEEETMLVSQIEVVGQEELLF